MASETITLVAALEFPILNDGVRALLEVSPSFRIAATSCDGLATVDLCIQLKPDAVLLSEVLEGLSGIEVARRLRAAGLTCSIVFLARNSTSDVVARALRAGASGFLNRQATTSELVAALRRTVAGEPYFSATIASTIVQDYVRRLDHQAPSDPYELLSEGERHVLQLVAEGSTSSEIATRLYITVKAVEKTRQRIMKKLDVRDMASLVRAAVRLGIVAD